MWHAASTAPPGLFGAGLTNRDDHWLQVVESQGTSQASSARVDLPWLGVVSFPCLPGRADK